MTANREDTEADFVETEADLATHPVFSPDVLKSERRRIPDKDKKPRYRNRRDPPDLRARLNKQFGASSVQI